MTIFVDGNKKVINEIRVGFKVDIEFREQTTTVNVYNLIISVELDGGGWFHIHRFKEISEFISSLNRKYASKDRTCFLKLKQKGTSLEMTDDKIIMYFKHTVCNVILCLSLPFKVIFLKCLKFSDFL